MSKVVNLGGLQAINYLRFRKNPLSFLFDTQELGEIVAINPSYRPISYIVHSPEAIKDLLTVKDEQFTKGPSAQIFGKTLGNSVLTSEGPEHRRQRKLMQPAFHKQKIAGYAKTVVAFTEELCSRWNDGEERSISQDMMDLTLRVIVETMFGADIRTESQKVAWAVNAIIEKTSQSLMLPISLLDRLPTRLNRHYRQGVETVDQLAGQLIESQLAYSTQGEHLLSLLLQARYEDGKPLSQKEIRDQIVTMLIAGHETTANALTWIWLLLSQNPEVEKAFHQELDRVLQGRIPVYEDLPRLTYTMQIVQEALRLYPPAWIILREAKNDVEIAGHLFEKGSSFLISPYTLHRDRRLFSDPLCFKPERFSKEQQAIPTYAYLPFGAGSRGCIGSQFALMEAVMVLAMVGQTWRLRRSAPDIPIRTEPFVSLRVKNGLAMTIEKRALPNSSPSAGQYGYNEKGSV